MRFRFCGDLDCPDWVLAEMNILSKITSVRLKIICGQIVNEMLGGSIDYAKVNKLVSVAKYDISDVKASVAAIAFIISNAVKFNVEVDTLSNELQQLGLPKEHVRALCRTYGNKGERLRIEMKKASLRAPILTSLNWRVDYILTSSELKEVNLPSIQLKLEISNSKNESETVNFEVSDSDFSILLNDLKQARAMMDGAVN